MEKEFVKYAVKDVTVDIDVAKENENDLDKLYINDVINNFIFGRETGESIEDITRKVFEECDLKTAGKFVDYISDSFSKLISDLNVARLPGSFVYYEDDMDAINKTICDIINNLWFCQGKTAEERIQFVRVRRERFGTVDYRKLKTKIHESDNEIGIRIAMRLHKLEANHNISMQKFYNWYLNGRNQESIDELFDMAIISLKETIRRMAEVKNEYIKPVKPIKPGKELKKYLNDKRIKIYS